MKHTLTRLLALMLCLCLVLPFAGCGNSEEPVEQPESSDVSTDATESTEYVDPSEYTEDTLYEDPSMSTEDTLYTDATDYTDPTAETLWGEDTTAGGDTGILPEDTQATTVATQANATTSTQSGVNTTGRTEGAPTKGTTKNTTQAATNGTTKATNGTTQAATVPTYTVPTYTYPTYTVPTYTVGSTQATTKTNGTTAATTKAPTQAATQATTKATTKATTQATTVTATQAVTTATTQPTTATTTRGKKPVVTFTATTEWTTTTKDKSSGKAIKVLAIGNSFSVDAMHNHLFDIFESAGYTDITLGNLYIGGCSLDTHYDNLKSNSPAYTFYLNTDNDWVKREGVSAATGIAAAKWDVITIQQVSSDSGRPQCYQNLQSTLNIIKQKAPRAKILWHMTWAYQQDSDHWAFQHYNKDQMTMYNAIVSTVQEQVLTQNAINGIIPAGTAIQNLRTSGLGDTLTSDGHHLRDTYGDYTAALTWFCAITDESVDVVTYCPGNISDYGAEMAQSVTNALKTPFAVTPCN